MSKLHFRYSAMNSGKSTRLIQEAHNYESRGFKIIIIKPAIDTKGSDTIISRIGVDRKADLLISPTDSLTKKIEPLIKGKKIACVFVDEAQFLTARQVDQLFWDISQDMDIPVIAYGLRADFRSKPFPGSERLMSLADELQEMPTVCRCGKKARFNTRKSNGKFVFEGEQVAIDGEGVEYESLCKDCYREEYLKSKSAIQQLL